MFARAGYRSLPKTFPLRQLSTNPAPITPASSQLAPLVTNTWVDRLPPKLQPYALLARVDKPIGTMLLLWPCTWSITMASYVTHAPISVPLTYLSLFGIGAFIMRGAGCTINDMWDRNLDKAVALQDRTRTRPLARGDLTPWQALGFLGVQLSAGLAVLTQLNCIFLGASSLSLVIVYPVMKRITYWPQSVLGLAFNWGALLGWSAVAGAVDWSVCLPLYAGSVCWTMVYDTIYAHQDKKDDPLTGIRSTALLFGDNSRPILSAFALSSVGLIGLAGLEGGMGLGYFAGLGLGAIQLARILYRVDFDDRADCWKAFVRCGWFGFWMWAGTTVDYITLLLS
ncbi:4-hydroxybenzoate polyprenyltransferase, mitochondrial, partial [Rhizoctonia solani]